MKNRTFIIIFGIVFLLFIITGMVVNTVADNTNFRYENRNISFEEYQAELLEREVYPTINTFIEGIEEDLEFYKDNEIITTYLKERLDIILKAKYQIKSEIDFFNLQYDKLKTHTRSYIDRVDIRTHFYECYVIEKLAVNDRYTNLLRNR